MERNDPRTLEQIHHRWFASESRRTGLSDMLVMRELADWLDGCSPIHCSDGERYRTIRESDLKMLCEILRDEVKQ